MKNRPWSWLRYQPIKASETTRQSLAGLAVTVYGLVAVLLVSDTSYWAKASASVSVLVLGALVARWLLRPPQCYCFLVADTTDMGGEIAVSPKLWIHADGPVPPGSGYINPWGAPKGRENYHAIGKRISWSSTSARGIDTGVRLPPRDYSIDFTAGHLNWEEHLEIYWENKKLEQSVTVIPEHDRPFSPDIYEH